MIWPILTFIVLFLALSAFLMAVSFHVFRFRYNNDASIFIFSTLSIIYILIAILVFIFFKYSEPTPKADDIFTNFTINNI